MNVDFPRFWDKVKKTKTCWIWQGAKSPAGYGRFMFGGSTLQAHRLAFELKGGLIPDGQLVCHKCDNPPCVRPDHLFVGDHFANARDMAAKGRSARFNGKIGQDHHMARLTSEQVAWVRANVNKTHPGGRNGSGRIARELGVTRATILGIINGTTRRTG